MAIFRETSKITNTILTNYFDLNSLFKNIIRSSFASQFIKRFHSIKFNCKYFIGKQSMSTRSFFYTQIEIHL